MKPSDSSLSLTDTHKVYVFVLKDKIVAKGQFDQWCAFAETETEAKINIHVRHDIKGEDLHLVEVLNDRRARPRRNGDRRVKNCAKCGGPIKVGPFHEACEKCDPFMFQPCGNCRTVRVYCTC